MVKLKSYLIEWNGMSVFDFFVLDQFYLFDILFVFDCELVFEHQLYGMHGRCRYGVVSMY